MCPLPTKALAGTRVGHMEGSNSTERHTVRKYRSTTALVLRCGENDCEAVYQLLSARTRGLRDTSVLQSTARVSATAWQTRKSCIKDTLRCGSNTSTSWWCGRDDDFVVIVFDTVRVMKA